MGLWRRLAFSLLLLLLLRGLGQSPWVAAAAPALRWLLGDLACGALLGLAVLAGPWLGLWMPHWLSLAAMALLLTLLPARPPPGLRWLPADLAYTFRMLRLGLRTWARLRRRPPDTFVDAFERHARAQPGRTILVCTGPGGRAVTFRELDARACQAAWALKAELASAVGLRAREPTALLVLPSQTLPALSLWLGLAKLGCPVVWINPHGRGPPLVHAVLSSGARVLVVDPELRANLEEVLPKLQAEKVHCLYLGRSSPTPGVGALGAALAAAPSDPVPADLRADIKLRSPALFIYTSGTTGLPKPAILTYERVLQVAGMLTLCGVTADDVVYTVLPLYHTMGLVLGVLSCLDLGVTCVLAPKFSASGFWDDCRQHGVTVIQYVGEILRYLCNTPQRPEDRTHKVRLAIGNGLRAEVWETFQRRFGPIRIWEMYGSTEGNVGFINYPGRCGAQGKTSCFLQMLSPFELVQYSLETEEPLRDSQGLCIPARPGEAGLLLTQVLRHQPFLGYRGPRELSEKKLVKNVRRTNDLYYNTGDVLAMDHEGFLYFRDRLGDTFRWKGENVSTREVEGVLSVVDFLQEVNVYGVPVPGAEECTALWEGRGLVPGGELPENPGEGSSCTCSPGCEGKVGMAAVQLVPGQAFDGQRLYQHVRTSLPAYAAPHFIRIQDALEITGTFKLVKSRLVREGFNVSIVADPLFVLDNEAQAFRPLTPDIYRAVCEGAWRL